MKDENYPPLTPPKEGDSFPLGRLMGIGIERWKSPPSGD